MNEFWIAFAVSFCLVLAAPVIALVLAWLLDEAAQ